VRESKSDLMLALLHLIVMHAVTLVWVKLTFGLLSAFWLAMAIDNARKGR